MADELENHYVALFQQFDLTDDFAKGQCEGLRLFLRDPRLTKEGLVKKLLDFRARAETPNNGYMTGPEDCWLLYLDSFERKGTIRGPADDPAIEQQWREHRNRVALDSFKDDPGLYNLALEYSQKRQ